jgi:hypothetical protein
MKTGLGFSTRFTFEWTYDGDETFEHEQVTLEAPDVWAAWRRLAGQLINVAEGSRVPLNVRLLDTPDAVAAPLKTRTKGAGK